MAERPATLVLGIGNLLWADEGFGVRAVEALDARYSFPDGVTLMDGGTQGLYLLPCLQACEALVILDAVDFSLEPVVKETHASHTVPALLFFRHGRHIGTIPRVQDWADYIARVRALLDASPEARA